jgi:hypothetical protein
MSKAHLDLLKYLWVGFRLDVDSQLVVAPNGKVVCRVLARTITECAYRGWIVVDPDSRRYQRYRLTSAGRQRVLVKERVREFVQDLSNHSTT